MSFETTSNFHLYLKYKEIKDSLAYNYKGVDLSKVIAWNMLGIVVYGADAKLKDSIFLPFLRIDTLKIANLFELHTTVISRFFANRNDYNELLNSLHATIQNSVIVPINPHKKSLRINIQAVRIAKKLVFNNNKLREYNFENKLHLACRIIYACHQVDDLEKTFCDLKLERKNYIPFNSAIGIEALLTLFFKSKGVKTYHIFHGIFGRYKIKIANDIINGENITAENILAYSESTKDDLIRDFGHPPDKILIAGNPKFPFKDITVCTKFRKCIVLNGFGFYDNEFLQLLTLLDTVSQETGIAFDVKPHPTSKILLFPEIKKLEYINFIPKGKTVKELFSTENYDFAITFNTVTYYECMYYNLICLRYSIGENLNFDGLDDRFMNKESLLQLIDYLKQQESHDLNQSITQLLINTLGMGINNYNQLN